MADMTDAKPATTDTRWEFIRACNALALEVDQSIAEDVRKRGLAALDADRARVKALEDALRKYGLQERKGLTYHGFTCIGFRCQLCECEWVEPERENHDPSCLLHGTSRVAPATGDANG